MGKRILFIEDNPIKAKAVSEYINTRYPEYTVLIKDSFRVGLRELIKNDFDLLFLDMSLPTWEREASSSPSGFERFGGVTILREMKRKRKEIPTIVITMFSEFGVGQSFIDLIELDKHLSHEFKSFYKGFVKYSSSEGKWEKELSSKLKSL